jgi:hypothetical protein
MALDFLLGNYKTVAERLGLTVEGGRIHGVVSGIPLQMWFGPHATHVGALLPATAPIDLGIATKSLLEKLGELFGGHTADIGDPVFDKTFSVRCSDPARLSELLNAGARQALLEVAKEGLHPALDPNSIHLRRFSQGGLADSDQMIERDFHEAARLARVVGDSFAHACR